MTDNVTSIDAKEQMFRIGIECGQLIAIILGQGRYRGIISVPAIEKMTTIAEAQGFTLRIDERAAEYLRFSAEEKELFKIVVIEKPIHIHRVK